ncbi:amidohydrolase family protein [Desulfovibrio sp. OttesenSCG-928-G11]|nr:amidohydrolase family protein [Desulfovibrio sp. OttesenSCG-928-G11]
MPEAIRASHIVPFLGQGPARGLESLLEPLELIEDAVLLVSRGRIEGLESYADFRRRAASDYALTDLGELCLAPGLVNAHCHLELSYLGGSTLSGKGFAAWLKSLVLLLRERRDQEEARQAMVQALEEMLAAGAAHCGDVSRRMPLEISAAAASLAESMGIPYPLTHFLECMGFTEPESGSQTARGYSPLPMGRVPLERRKSFIIAGHALYSTDPKALRAASYWCWERGRVFGLHLAESRSEHECLTSGSGPLYEVLRGSLLPFDWEAPGMSPVEYADKLQLLTPFTLAAHCVHLSDADIERLSLRGANVCLCPRSNEYIGVGRARAKDMAGADILLCLGTDGLCSNHDLDMQKEMRAAIDFYGLPGRAVLRMATLNGAYALGLDDLGSLTPGNAAAWCALAPDLARAVLDA